MHKTIRSFIALYPDSSAREQMSAFIACLKSRYPSIRWEQPDKIHITMKFLGDVEPATLDAITAQLRSSIHPSPPIDARIDRTGAFPSLQRPRIVWLGFTEMLQPVLDLQRITEETCERHGIERERKSFTPHFTIGRVKQHSDTIGLENALEACSFSPVPVRFIAVRVMESTLTPQGAVHRERARIELTPGE
ncbi:MAG: RNA 2',3'-cyclic phosphodiesterase [Bacteroidetes bacterium]|nr:RNA 2',3'-cyclic phosphodiesterase [Bacteroidota bacterium]